jgi:hypothetical protein
MRKCNQCPFQVDLESQQAAQWTTAHSLIQQGKDRAKRQNAEGATDRPK